ncbi:MAG TPA: DegT/DnrJ/EryC1/StrS family aminotransferase [bacterium]|nr:DegT/DnrJ/EryC1/StrS family aminotransferase [bacterium]
MRIPNLDETWQHRQLLPTLEGIVRRVLIDEDFAVTQAAGLEQDVSAFLGGGHAVAVQSGTAALFLTLLALGVGSGDEVITAPNSDLATTASISHTGARFVFCDVEPDTMNLDPALVENRISPRTKAILPVHLYGHPAEMGPVVEIARRHRLLVIEDACLSIGASYHGQATGLIGKAGCFSFGIRKVISGAGTGGMVVTHDPELARRIRLLRAVGQYPAMNEMTPSAREEVHGQQNLVEGYYLQLNNMQAAIIREKLHHLREWQARRQDLADRYARHFAGTRVTAPVVRPGCTHAWRDYVVQLPHRAEVRRALREAGIATALRYVPPVYLQPVYRHLGLGPGSFPVAERLADRVLGLPMYPGLHTDQVDEVASAVLAALRTVND